MKTKTTNIIQPEKNVLIQFRIKPSQKANLENIFDRLGITTTQAISMFFAQVENTLRLPISLDLSDTSSHPNYEIMKNPIRPNIQGNSETLTKSELNSIKKSLKQITEGKVNTLNSVEDIAKFIDNLG
jgi:addiction module RelB/DinJ family antitoxin